MKKYLHFAVFIATMCNLNAQEMNQVENNSRDTLKTYEQPQVSIFGNREEQLRNFAGSADLISSKEIREAKPISGSEMLKQVSGIHINEEDGMGLRMNLGVRGLDPDRSRTIHVMEDGVPMALAPYGEPEMYYTPAIERISDIEVLKGSGSIVFGPQTIGGVINYITFDPPIDPTTKISVRGGRNGYFSGSASYGATMERHGYTFNVLHKRADNIGVLGFEVTDLTAKFNLMFSESSRIGVKFSVYNESSDATYVGLTQTMFNSGQYFAKIAPSDKLDVRRYSLSLTHHQTLGTESYLKTTAFGYTTTRNWMRQDFSRTKSGSLTGVVWGDTSLAGGAIYMRNSTGNRDRQFEVYGVEPRFFTKYNLAGLSNDLEAGARILGEVAYEQSVNGKKAGTLSGDLVLDEVRTGLGIAAFIQNKVYITPQFSITPGIRLEQFSYERQINRVSSRDTLITGSDNLTEVIPGLGLNYTLGKHTTIFAGLHKGFAPPRIKDAIDNTGATLKLEAERSTNIEFGVRTQILPWLGIETTVYRLDFSNQILPVSASSGGAGFGLINGGKTLHQGIELGTSILLTNFLTEDLNTTLKLSGSISESKYNSDRFVSGKNVKGNKLPYAPEMVFNGSLEMNYKQMGIQLGINSVGEHFADELNTVTATNDGQIGLIPSYTIVDVTLRYTVEKINATIFFSAKNLSDERYISSRRPQGIKVGLPRLITAGIDLRL